MTTLTQLNLPITGIRTASLLRALAWRNGGTFVGLTGYR